MEVGAWAASLLLTLPSLAGTPRFRECAIERKHDEALFADLDGDRLEDLVLVDGTELAVFFQDPAAGSGRSRTRPTDWPARRPSSAGPRRPPGREPDAVDHSGVSELAFAERPARRRRKVIDEAPMISPRRADGPVVFPLRLSARTAGSLRWSSCRPARTCRSGASRTLRAAGRSAAPWRQPASSH